MEKILILDFGSQYTQLIARGVREGGSYAEIVPFNKGLEHCDQNLKGIILSGGPRSVHEGFSPKPDPKIYEQNVPILGICYGMQLLAEQFGGEVIGSEEREFGHAEISFDSSCPLFTGINSSKSVVWMSHGDRVNNLPEIFEKVAQTENSPFCAISHKEKPIFGIQFHPEVHHSQDGKEILKGFLQVCQIAQNWEPGKLEEYLIQEIKDLVADDKVVLGVSGGVDSTVAAVLLNKAIGKNCHCIFVDNGLLRKNERDEVEHIFRRDFDFNLTVIRAEEEFLGALEGVIDPEQKRKIIGRVFVDVFSREAKKIDGVKFLGQGTLYPDVIESISVYGPSDTIKTHHNVGGLPEKMNLKLVEPLRFLFKDEVRRLGDSMGIPRRLLWRHPFPGPGLAVRILNEITKEKLEILKEADAIVEEELLRAGWYDRCWQCFGVLTDAMTVGVMGDERTYERVFAVRAVESVDAMTADWVRLPYDLLARFANRVINEVKGINRVVFDITSKPPGTIEWE